MSVIEVGVGDPDAAPVWADWAREQVQAWEDVSSGQVLLDELVPW